VHRLSDSRQAATADLVNYTHAAADLGFPQPTPSLLAYRDTQDVAAMRRHGWQIWAAMTQPTRPIEWGRGVQNQMKMGFFSHLSPTQQAELATHERDGNDFETFARVVAIDPGRTQIPRGETAEVFFFDPEDRTMESTVRRKARVVPLQDFLHVQINDSYTVDLIKSQSSPIRSPHASGNGRFVWGTMSC
jgi:hypothetical protein